MRGLILSLSIVFSATTQLACAQSGMTTVAFTGDSITAVTFNAFNTDQHTWSNTLNQLKGDQSWSMQALIQSRGNFQYFRNWAQHGAKSEAIVNNIATTMLAQSELPDVLVCAMGANDVATGSPTADLDVISEYLRLVSICDQYGVELIPCTIIPNANSNVNVMTTRNRANLWIRQFARKRKLRMIDLHETVVGPDGTLPPTIAGDGVHPGNYGHYLMGRAAAKVLRGTTASTQPLLTQAGGDGDKLNKFYNGAFLPFSTRPGGWTGDVFTQVNSETIKGKWARYAQVAHTDAKWILDSGSLPASPGHFLVLAARIRCQNFDVSGNNGLYFRVTFSGATSPQNEIWPIFACKFADNLDDENGYLFSRRMVVPVGATDVRLQVLVSKMAEPYVVDLAQMTLYDLTAQGLVSAGRHSTSQSHGGTH